MTTYRLIHSHGRPEYAVWVRDGDTQRWHCWGQVHSPEDHPNLLEEINSGKYFNSNYSGYHNYVEIKFLPNDGNHSPNR